MKSNQQTKESLIALARLLKRHHDEKAVDGSVGKWDWMRILAKSAGDLYDAMGGVTEIAEEAADYSAAELDDLYNTFLDELGWTPSPDTGEKFQIAFEGLRDAYLKALQLKNTFHPPRAEIAP